MVGVWHWGAEVVSAVNTVQRVGRHGRAAAAAVTTLLVERPGVAS